MDAPDIDERSIHELITMRDRLLFMLANQFPPPEPAAARLWEAHNAIRAAVEELKRLSGYDEPGSGVGWTSNPTAGS